MFVPFLKRIGVADFFDILMMSFLIYTLLLLVKKTRAGFVLLGILIIAGVYLMARQFDLRLTAFVFQGFFAVILVAVVVIFQEELRHFFERIAVWGLSPKLRHRRSSEGRLELIALLVRTLTDLAARKHGALIVLKGKDAIHRHLEGGVALDGLVSAELLKSLFDPHSEGHDGAVVIAGDQVIQFACHLPLSKNIEMLDGKGTRHAAALGLSERTDALCLVVSEERGKISIARAGELTPIANAQHLSRALSAFYREFIPRSQRRLVGDILQKNVPEKAIAIAAALVLWFLYVYGSNGKH